MKKWKKIEKGEKIPFPKKRKIIIISIILFMILAFMVILINNNNLDKNTEKDTSNSNLQDGKLEEYSISYDLDGGEFPENSVYISSYNSQSEITLLNPEKDGYIFSGWTGSNGNTPEVNLRITIGNTGDKTYKANWIEILEDEKINMETLKKVY